MDAPASESKLIDSFKMHVATIESANLEQLHALSVSVGWPLRSEDLQFLRDCGRGYVAHDDIGRLTGSAMWFPHADDFATIGMVITSPRLQSNGTARWLMEHVLWDCCGRNLRLNATRPPAGSIIRSISSPCGPYTNARASSARPTRPQRRSSHRSGDWKARTLPPSLSWMQGHSAFRGRL